MSGTFIVVEGPDGVGKTTLLTRLARELDDRGHTVCVTREPGGTAVGQKIREILLSGVPMDLETQMVLFAADRREHLENVVKPALAAGRVVLSDRFTLSSLVYQTVQGVGRTWIDNLHRVVLDTHPRTSVVSRGLRPDLSLLLSIPVEVALARLEARGSLSTFDAKPKAYHQRVHEAYQRFGIIEGYTPVAADGEPYTVFERVLGVLDTHLPELADLHAPAPTG